MPPAGKGRKAEEARRLRETLRRFTNGFRDWLEEQMSADGMTVPQLRLLFAVDRDSSASSAAIARQCQVTPQTLQAMMQRAVRERWIVRRPSPENARVLVASLTPKGRVLLQRATDAVVAFEAEVWKGTGVSQLQAVNALLETGLARMEAMNDKAL